MNTTVEEFAYNLNKELEDLPSGYCREFRLINGDDKVVRIRVYKSGEQSIIVSHLDDRLKWAPFRRLDIIKLIMDAPTLIVNTHKNDYPVENKPKPILTP